MLRLDPSERAALWARLVERIEDYIEHVDDAPVSIPVDAATLRAQIARFDFTEPIESEAVIDSVADLLWANQVHVSHRRYYGLFNPNPSTMGIAADALVAAFNPQLAAWSHNPAACEIEQHLVRALGQRFGYREADVAGSFTSGGAEANHSALVCALLDAFPEVKNAGVRALDGDPVFYVSEESHHSFAKAAQLSGIGNAAARLVPLTGRLVMDTAALEAMIETDRAAGRKPFLVAATMGTTNAGLIDPIEQICDVAVRHGIWVHADAAWGGGAIMAPELRASLGAIERADSITFDAHKWLSVPMGAGMFFTRHPEVLRATFGVDTQYMPVTAGSGVIEPHMTTMQWSRRFIGLKLFMTLARAGWEGYAETVRHQYALGNVLRTALSDAGWRVVNDTPLPTVCFVDDRSDDNSLERLAGICRAVVNDGRAWLSTTRMGGTVPVLRATVTNYRTTADDIATLVSDLDEARNHSEAA